ncbi:MAG: patatin-like phospholipase family protein [Bacteroidetes bacterium]|nr:patatin-like phospholipase family protein [Bacteroidota bacterium]
MFRKPKCGVALGGGGARGLAHVGVLKVLHREEVPIHIITGSSMGAVVGGMYAETGDIETVERNLLDFFSSEDFKKTGMQLFRKELHPENFYGQIAHSKDTELVIQLDRNRVSLMKEYRLGVIMDHLLSEGYVENTRIQFAPVATNLETGEVVVFRSGKLRDTIKASAAVPGFLPPILYREMVLVDGAISSSIPVEPARSLGADMLIAVNVSRALDEEPMPQNVIDILFRTNLITSLRLDKLTCEMAEVVLQPDVGSVHWAEFDRITELIDAGEKEAEKAMPLIRKALKKKGFKPNKKVKRKG